MEPYMNPCQTISTSLFSFCIFLRMMPCKLSLFLLQINMLIPKMCTPFYRIVGFWEVRGSGNIRNTAIVKKIK